MHDDTERTPGDDDRDCAQAGTTQDAERMLAEQEIVKLYARMRLAPPQAVVWCQSPLQALMVATLLPLVLSVGKRKAGLCDDYDWAPPDSVSSAESAVAGCAEEQMLAKVWKRTWARLRDIVAELGEDFTLSPCDMASALAPAEEERTWWLFPIMTTPAHSPILTDLRARLRSAYESTNSATMPVSLVDSIHNRLASSLPSHFENYLLRLYSGGVNQTTHITRRNRDASRSFLSANLHFLTNNIQFLRLANKGCGAILFPSVCFAIETPYTMRTSPAGRLHLDDGPALVFNDGYEIYALDGIVVDRNLITDPGWLTPEGIAEEQNQELKRVMLNRFGVERFIEEWQFTPIAEDAYGVLYREKHPSKEALSFVKVKNSTPEPDGSHKTYFLRVPPYVESAREAIAWTFGLSEDEYEPALQT